MRLYYVLEDGAYDGEPYAEVKLITKDRAEAESKLAELNEQVDKSQFDKNEIELKDYIDYWQDGFYNQWHYHVAIETYELKGE